MTYLTHPYIGYLYNYQWLNAYDDSRQVVYLNQFAVDLNDYNYLQAPYNYLRRDFDIRPAGQDSPYLAAFRDMVPEVGRILQRYSYADVEVAIRKIGDLYPQWYLAYAEGTLGWEHNLSHPVDSFQIFNARAWIEDAPAADLGRYADISWLSEGDFFYMQKLSEAIKAYRGYSWKAATYIRLGVIPGDGTLTLVWKAVLDETEGVTWTIDLEGPDGNQSISGLPFETNTYQFSGLRNYAWYTITLSAVDGTGQTLLATEPRNYMPSDILFYLPALMNGGN
jgi:hypothetical protein